MPQRFAIYYAPATDDPLWSAASSWLGRDAADDAARPAADIEGVARDVLDANSVSARRYGFHATIKAPMALDPDYEIDALEAALSGFAETHAPVTIGVLKPTLIDGFLALIPVVQPDALTDFAGKVVESFDGFRAPLNAVDREKRLKGGRLTARQVELLDRFGYPYVFEQFQFHMTLTDRLEEALKAPMVAAAERHFAMIDGRTMVLDRLVVFAEPEPGAPFVRRSEFVLKGGRHE